MPSEARSEKNSESRKLSDGAEKNLATKTSAESGSVQASGERTTGDNVTKAAVDTQETYAALKVGLKQEPPAEIAVKLAKKMAGEVFEAHPGPYGSTEVSWRSGRLTEIYGVSKPEADAIVKLLRERGFSPREDPVIANRTGIGTKGELANQEIRAEIEALNPGTGLGGIAAAYQLPMGGDAKDMRRAGQGGNVAEGLASLASGGRGGSNPQVPEKGGAASGKPSTYEPHTSAERVTSSKLGGAEPETGEAKDSPGSIDRGRGPNNFELDSHGETHQSSNKPLEPHPVNLKNGPSSDIPLASSGELPKKPIEQRHGEPSTSRHDLAGTGYRKGQYYRQFNEAELTHGLKVQYDSSAGRPIKVSYELNGKYLEGKPNASRSFTRDASVEGAQGKNAAYRGSGYERGHLAQREAFKSSKDAERAADHHTNVVPMIPSLNSGVGSAWKAAEADTVRLAKEFGSVKVEVEPLYTKNPPRLSDGTPIPDAINRVVKGRDGTVLRSDNFVNRMDESPGGRSAEGTNP
jgi:hypothetical protein